MNIKRKDCPVETTERKVSVNVKLFHLNRKT